MTIYARGKDFKDNKISVLVLEIGITVSLRIQHQNTTFWAI